jgi:hypothetical protein
MKINQNWIDGQGDLLICMWDGQEKRDALHVSPGKSIRDINIILSKDDWRSKIWVLIRVGEYLFIDKSWRK